MDLSQEGKNNSKGTIIPRQKELKIGLILIGLAILGVATGMFIMMVKHD